jgi:malonate-semialdehyde dehydrogenase (acetylating)/methylmalonate-semialdehyde dehydrogenase
MHGTEGVSFYTQAKVVTSRWPQPLEASGAHLSFPTAH